MLHVVATHNINTGRSPHQYLLNGSVHHEPALEPTYVHVTKQGVYVCQLMDKVPF